MRSLEQIVHDNGGDNTPALDTHNLTGRSPNDFTTTERVVDGEVVEVIVHVDDLYDTDDAWYEARIGYYEDDGGTVAPLATFDELLDCE